MKKLLPILLALCLGAVRSQDSNVQTLKGTVINAQTQLPMENVHVVNLNQVIGTITNQSGEFTISAKVNDSLYFSYIGYKTITVRVTNDMFKFDGTKISLTELAYALEDVVVRPFQLTGYLEVDAKNIPINNSGRYSISGLSKGYEAGNRNPGAISRVLGAIFNPADFLHNVFGSKPQQMRKLRKMKEDDEIRDLLASKFDRETLTAMLQVDRFDIDDILRNCNYSDDFIRTANDLQILDAISGCYEEYKVLNREN